MTGAGARDATLFLLLASACSMEAAGQESVRGRTGVMTPPHVTTEVPRLSKTTLHLEEAVQLTWLYDPEIQREKQEVAFVQGRLQEASGFFDPLVRAEPKLFLGQKEMVVIQKTREVFKRRAFQVLEEVFTALSQQIQVQLRQNDLAPPRCPEGINLRRVSIVDAADSTARLGLAFEDTIFVFPPDLTRDLDGLFSVCRAADAIKTQPESILETLKQVNRVKGLGLSEFLESGSQIPTEILNTMRKLSDSAAAKSRLAYERLGGVPEDETTKEASLEFGFFKPMRTGLAFSFDLKLKGTERNFKGKPLDPSFGGLGLRNEFPSSLSVKLDVPIGKGRGSVTTTAPERAARLGVEAEREQLRQAMSEEAFRTVLSYLNLQAAQQSLALLEESAARRGRLLGLTRAQVAAGEVPRAELDRVQAQRAEVDARVAAGKVSLLKARLALAEEVGLEVSELGQAPLAGDSFPARLEMLPAERWLADRALVQRRDVRATHYLREASAALANGARADLRHRLNFSITTGLSTLYESPVFKYLPDELPEPQPAPPVRYYSGYGVARSFDGAWKPFVRVEITLEVPFRNNAAEGRLLQNQASLKTSEIQASDLERTIRDNVVQFVGALSRQQKVVEERRGAVGYYQETLDAALARYEAGEITLVDTLLTEEDLTRERLQLVAATQTYLSFLARLKFEVGELVSFELEGTPQEIIEFAPKGLVAR